ncbi:hypothetical protein ACHAXT_002021 [Thalassiosira profunda]
MGTAPPLALPLDSPACTPSNAGGKGANLSLLLRASNSSSSSKSRIAVPPGFVVTTAAYRRFLAADDGALLTEIEKELVQHQTGEEADLEAASANIRAAFRQRRLDDALRAEIERQLSALLPNENESEPPAPIYLAVRSSATCEDLPGASFAGQHDTYLHVPPSEACERVVDCFSSLFAARAISYRERQNVSHADAGMAVVVQKMASSRQTSAGVLFTANPLTGRRNECVLEAIPGLGEALVSGLTEPDRYVVSKGRGGESGGEIKDRRIGAKATAIVSVEGGGVKEEHRTELATETTPLVSSTEQPSQPPPAVLTDDDVQRLVAIGQEVERVFDGAPQDIEWAMAEDGEISIVQSRPITTLVPLPKVPSEPLQVFFSFNAVQGIIAPIYPAGQDAVKAIMGGLLRGITWGRYGNEGTFVQPVAERLYFNVTTPLRNTVGRKVLRKLLPAIEPGILEGLVTLADEPDLSINSGVGPFFALRLLSLAAVVVPRYIFSMLMPDTSRRWLVQRIDRHVHQIEKKAEGVEGLAEVVAFQRETLSSFFPQIIPHAIPRMAAGMGPLAILTEMASSLPNGQDLVLTITRGLPHNVTTEMDLKLWNVAKAIKEDPTSLKLFSSADADALAEDYLRGRLPNSAQCAVAGFMGEYGIRGLYEIDFGQPRWNEDSTPLMNTLKSYLEIDEERAPDKVFAAGEVAAETAIRQLGEELNKPRLVSFLARRIRCIAGIRETPKFTMIRIMGLLRAKMLREGTKLVESGSVENAKDLFFLHTNELESLAAGQLHNCKAIVCERKALMERESERTRLPRVIASDGFAHFGGGASAANAKEGANAMCGEPVSPGAYEGRIRVIHDPRAEKLSQGEILCCHGTDPSWTPLFLSAGALVMEVGGLMTHGSVVAREYGIPAVVGLEKVTERLATGQRVRVDGSSGVVEILDDE